MVETTDKTAGDTRRRRHPGKGLGRARPFRKGRQVEDGARAEVLALLGEAPLERDRLIEYLHMLQDHFGHISAPRLAALARQMRLAQAEVYEVATFYAHFDVVKEGEPPPPPVTVRVCDSLSCALGGAEKLLAGLEGIKGREFRVLRAPCMGACDRAPAVAVGHNQIYAAELQSIERAVGEKRLSPAPLAGESLEDYRAGGGYKVLASCRDGGLSVDAVMEKLEAADLRGLGGAGFPSARKWQFVRATTGPRLLAINADEGEPGTFKDRYYLERQPHRFLEGMLIAAWGIEAAAVYIYLRDEYPAIHRLLGEEIEKLGRAGIIPPDYVHLRRGAGAYICGEESAMLESLEGKRGLPRHKPPFPAQVGLFGRPTLIHNVETVFWIRDIIEKGGGWTNGAGRRGRTGLRSFSVSGRVREPGVKRAPAGISVRELIDEYCGGMEDGHRFRAYLPGGASGGILPASMGDEPLDFGTLEKYGCFIGSAAVVVLSDQDNMRDVALNLLRFFEDESCGQCTPCRVGTEKAVRLLQAGDVEPALIDDLIGVMGDASICGLGQAAGNPLRTALRFFPEDFTARDSSE